MAAEGLPYGERTMTYTAAWPGAGKWADTQPRRRGIHDAFFRAYFVEARDISSTEVMLDIVKSVGCRGPSA